MDLLDMPSASEPGHSAHQVSLDLIVNGGAWSFFTNHGVDHLSAYYALHDMI